MDDTKTAVLDITLDNTPRADMSCAVKHTLTRTDMINVKAWKVGTYRRYTTMKF